MNKQASIKIISPCKASSLLLHESHFDGTVLFSAQKGAVLELGRQQGRPKDCELE